MVAQMSACAGDVGAAMLSDEEKPQQWPELTQKAFQWAGQPG